MADFSIPNSGILISGHWTTFSTYLDGKNGCRLDAVATGTDCSLRIQSVSGTVLKISVDGGADTTVSPGALSVDTYVALFSGLSDTAHTVRVICSSNSSVDIQKTNALRVTGASPSLSTPTIVGQQVRTGTPTGTAYISAPASLSWLRLEGGYALSNFNAGTYYQSALKVDVYIAFRATCTTLSIWVCQQAQTYRLSVDGVDSSQYVTCSNTGLWGWVVVGTGLSNAAEHEYGLQCVNVQSSWIYEVAVDTGGSINTSYVYAARSSLAFFGDSITECVTGTSNDSSLGFPHLLSLFKQFGDSNRGRSGTYLSASLGGSGSGESQTALITGLSPAPTTVFLMYGANDASASLAAGTFQTSFTNTLNSLISGTSYNIVCLGITDNSANQTAVNNLNAVIPTAIAACTTPSRCVFYSTAGWVSSGNFVSGAHPNAAGNIEIFNRIKATVYGVALMFKRRKLVG